MAQFSVKEAAKFSLSAYGKHFVLLLSAATLVAGSYWFATVAPRFVAEKLGVHQVLDVDVVTMMQQPAQGEETDQSRMVLQKVQEVTAKISTHLQTAPKHLLAVVLLVFLLVWGLYLTLVLGMMKLGLSLRDKNSGSVALLLQVSPRQVMRFIGASLLFGLYLICAFIGMAVLTIPFAILCKGVLGEKVTMLLTAALWVILLVAMLCWLVGYFFYGYCIVDKANLGAREALRMSRDISHGSRRRIIAAALLLGALGAVTMFIVNKVMMISGCACSLEQQRLITSLAVMIVTWPFSIPFFSFMYRSLSSKGR
jgi:hypothetical protein